MFINQISVFKIPVHKVKVRFVAFGIKMIQTRLFIQNVMSMAAHMPLSTHVTIKHNRPFHSNICMVTCLVLACRGTGSFLLTNQLLSKSCCLTTWIRLWECKLLNLDSDKILLLNTLRNFHCFMCFSMVFIWTSRERFFTSASSVVSLEFTNMVLS